MKKAPEEKNLDLNDEEDIRMKYSREEHWRDIADNGDYKSNIHDLKWDVYTRQKEELMKRKFLVSVPHPKGENIFKTCVKDYITKEKEDYKDI